MLKSKRRTTITVFSILLVIVSVLVYRHAVGISQARDAAEIAAQVASAWGAQTEKKAPDFNRLRTRLEQASATLDQARSNMVPGLQIASMAKWLPVYGDRIRSGTDLLEIADDLFSGGVILADVASDLSDTRFLTQDPVDGLPAVSADLFEQLSDRRDELVEARGMFESARGRLGSLENTDSGFEYLVNTGDINPAIDLMDSLIGLSLVVADHGGELLGYEGDARYIIVAVNADELRAGGGFSPGFWDVRIAEGKLIETNFYDSFELGATGVAPVSPPDDMLQTMWAGGWFFPDAAWYPDTARTTGFVTGVIEQSVGIEDVVAVLYVDQWAALSFISIAGEVALDDGRFVDENSFFELMQERTDVEGRKYLSTVFDGLVDSFVNSDAASSMGPALLEIFEALDARHMQVQLLNPEAQTQIAESGFDDVFTLQDTTDYVFVTDSNVGFSKVNRNITREIRYELDLADLTSPNAMLSVTHRNRSLEQADEGCEIQDARVAGSEYTDSMNACYWNLARVYSPLDIQTTTTPSFPMPDGALYRTVGFNDVEETLEVQTDGDFNVVSGLFTLAPGESATHLYEYQLPERYLNEKDDGFEYTLRVPKQAGLRNSTAIVEVLMPDGYGLKFADPAPLVVSPGRALFERPQDRDLEFRMLFSDSGIDRDGRNFSPVPDPPESSVVAFSDLSVFGAEETARMTSARITPSVIRVVPGGALQLTGTGIDQNGRRIEGTTARWAITDPRVGSIDRQGVFTASFETGIFRNSVEVTLTRADSFGTATATDIATVEIFDPALDVLDELVAYPPEIRVLQSQIVALRAIAWTVGGRVARNTTVEWRVNDESIGTVDSFGFLRVEGEPGIYPNAVTAIATQSGLDGVPTTTRETDFTFIVPSVQSFDNLARVTVLPRTANLRADQSFRFVPRAFTDRAAIAENVVWRWELSDTSLGTVDSNGVFTATDTVGPAGAEGLIRAIATQEINGEIIEIDTVSTINLLPPPIFHPLDFAEITSGTIETSASNRVLLTASGYSESGLRLPNLVRQWTVTDPRAGRIQSGATFVAGRTAGVYEDAIQLRLIQRDEDGELIIQTASADVVIASDVAEISIDPIPSPLARGQTIRLNATAFDENGRVVPDAAFIWHILDSEAGVVRPGGVFTAGLVDGNYSDVVRVYVARGR